MAAGGGGEYKPSEWYTKYNSYPPYCSTPEEMRSRQIPELSEDNKEVGETRILHATAIIRHGARTPWTSNLECWDGYHENVETGIWDCELTTIMAPPSPNTVAQEEGTYDPNHHPEDAFFLFEKRYDALGHPADGLTNELNGTCQVGQLLMQGYEQEIANGRILRKAYAFKSETYEHDERMRLIDTTSHTLRDEHPWSKKQLYYRADDDQRTLMSGQVLLRGLFDEEVMDVFYTTGAYPTIPVHTADRERDILDANVAVCPRLATLVQQALDSPDYQAFNNSEYAKNIREFMAKELGGADKTDLLDCLMTTMCTDRPLPEAINDYGEEDSKFQQLAEFVSASVLVA
jgi:hypothetical protein